MITNRIGRLWVLAGLCLLPMALEFWGDAGRLLLRYEREAIVGGEYWRLMTGHLVHLGWGHLLLNLAGLALLWALFASGYTLWRWLVIVLFSIACIDAGFLLFEPQLRWYVGLSGVLHGVMAAGTLAWLRNRERGAWVLAAFLVGKLAWEYFAGPMPFSAESAGGAVIVQAHLYGALGGALGAVIIRRR